MRTMRATQYESLFIALIAIIAFIARIFEACNQERMRAMIATNVDGTMRATKITDRRCLLGHVPWRGSRVVLEAPRR
jgi:hypothetical protein